MAEGARRPWVVPMAGRSPEEPHRTATPLELFFDLVFVVAIARASAELHHEIAAGHVAAGVRGYAMMFFGIWWAWMNFTWFASAYDTDDLPYRIVVFVQLIGALIFAAGLEQFADGDFRTGVLGYVVMRLAVVTQWLRASHADPGCRLTARRYALGILAVQACWIGWLLLVPPAWRVVAFTVLALAELAVPVWAERPRPTRWHPHHIAERYGLFTLIVLGESILAASTAIQSALTAGPATSGLMTVVAGGLLIVFSLWWIYFDRPAHGRLDTQARAFAWGYGHYFIFAAAGAVGAGLSVAIDQVTDHAVIGPTGAAAAVAIPVTIFLLSLWILHYQPEVDRRPVLIIGLVVAGGILATPPLGLFAIPMIGLILTGLLAFKGYSSAPSTEAGAKVKRGPAPDL